MKKITSLCFVIIICIYLTGCSGEKLLNVASVGNHHDKNQSLQFDDIHDLKVDIFYGQSHKTGSVANNPTVVFIYGGSWQSGSRSQYEFVADAFNQQGYNVLIPDYRLYPKTAYPGFQAVENSILLGF